MIRIGWKWEGNWYPWGINMNQDGARAFGACYRTIVQSIRPGYPDDHLIFDWIFPGWQAERNKTMALAAAGWPGDEYVDVIGMDMYSSEDSMDYIKLQFNLLHEFARSHGKPIAFPEWGLWGQDRPEYIEFMCDAIKDPANDVLYSIYFNVDALADHRLEAFPRSLATFKARCAGAQSARPLLGAGR